ncbi:hypothetical protein KUTeg_013482 [Tegillarca granosa]|uniref:5'-AMP-activated protein kinase subunit beta-1 n=1 Tax=Tegillarca granosa TaxID=220873 RepID=A0ABQ9EZ74_TEGGR|nr:hypothetical protein KUTeg_013482 [Tegillarca granosa]
MFRKGELDLYMDMIGESRALEMALGRPRAATSQSQGDTMMINKQKALPTVFKWEGGGKEVYISGSFNQWKTKIPMAKSHGDFFTIVELPEGDHQYKFLVDGQWVHNPNEVTNIHGDFITIVDLPEGDHQYKFNVDGQWVHNPAEPAAPNDMGTMNNVINVKKSDFEVFEALAIDSLNTPKKDSSGSPGGDYGQETPVRKPGEKYSGPPILPPHLLQVILNKDTPAHCEPTLLPEPNHVMLNHLYALSIKDGVMVLSATHRFRKKYVTTLLYKPI